MSNNSSRLSAAFAYVPLIGWAYVLLTQRGNALAIFHLRQSVGLCLFLIGVLLAWVVIAFVFSLLPMLVALGVALFTLVMVAWFYGIIAWVMGVRYALSARSVPLPVFGHWANRRLFPDPPL